MEHTANLNDAVPAVQTENGKEPGLIAAIVSGMFLGAIIGVAVGVFLRPKEDLAQLSREWLEELQDMTQSVADRVRSQLRDADGRGGQPIEAYEELPESYN